jgi:hypothetical protein
MTLSTAFAHFCGETSRSIRGAFELEFAHMPGSLTKPGYTVPMVTPLPLSSRSTDKLRAMSDNRTAPAFLQALSNLDTSVVHKDIDWTQLALRRLDEPA